MGTFANALDSGNWVAAWAGPLAQNPGPGEPLNNRTVRLRIAASVGGDALRVVLTNEYGKRPLLVGAASVATLGEGQRESAPVPLRFGGQRHIQIEAGAVALSNDAEIAIAPGQHLLLKLYLPSKSSIETAVLVQGPELPASHPLRVPDPSFHRVEISAEGDFTDVEGLSGARPGTHLPFLSRIDVRTDPQIRTIAIVGTTYTDGVDVWPDHLSARLSAGPGRGKYSIVNLSARGGAMSRAHDVAGRASVLSMFEREVLSLPGLSHVIISDARQDIITAGTRSLKADGSVSDEAHDVEAPITVDSLKAAYRQLIARGHARGLKVLAATMPPFRGVPAPGYYSEEKDEMREALNRWIIEGGEFDAFIDIDSMMRDPQDTRQYREEFRSANMFGPNAVGHQAIADLIDPTVFA